MFQLYILWGLQSADTNEEFQKLRGHEAELGRGKRN